jgi:bisphosphoglycerate-independent phosphoglycerate mutase (AlkP superfamily)
MAYVGPEWSHGIAYDDTGHTNVAKRGGSWLGVDRQGRWSSKGVDCDILASEDGDIHTQDLIELIEYSYQQGASSFLEAYLERTSKLSVLGLEQFGMGDRPESLLGCA